MQFTKSLYYNDILHRKDKGPPINTVDAWLIHQYLLWSKPIKNYLEIGVGTGAVYSLVAEQQPWVKIDLVDPRIHLCEDTIKKLKHQHTSICAKYSHEVDWVNNDKSYDIFYAYHPMEQTTEVMESALSRTTKNTMLWIDRHEDCDIVKVRNMLKEQQWQQRLVTDQLEWWTWKDNTIQPFINYLLRESNINYVAGIWQEKSVWKVSAPQCVYNNPDVFNQI